MTTADFPRYFAEVQARLDAVPATLPVAGLQNYFETMRVRLDVVKTVKKEIDRLVAPDFSLFNVLWADEVRLSNMIANLLNPAAPHGQGDKFLNAFLEVLEVLAAIHQNSSVAQTVQHLKQAWKNTSTLKVGIEQSTHQIANTQRRMDVLVHGNGYALMIENKPWAIDQEKQLQDYGAHLDKEYDGKYLMVYLSGNGTSPDKSSLPSDCKNALETAGKLSIISYRPHLITWLQRCLSLAEADRVRWIIGDFATYIEQNFSLKQFDDTGEHNEFV